MVDERTGTSPQDNPNSNGYGHMTAGRLVGASIEEASFEAHLLVSRLDQTEASLAQVRSQLALAQRRSDDLLATDRRLQRRAELRLTTFAPRLTETVAIRTKDPKAHTPNAIERFFSGVSLKLAHFWQSCRALTLRTHH